MNNKVILITAGATGIGRAVARHFSTEGYRVHVCDVNQSALRQLCTELPQIGSSCVDLTQPAQVDDLFDTIHSDYGELDILVNNVGIAGPTAAVENITLEDWQRTIDVDLNSIFYVARRAVPLLKQSRGCMINMSSNAGLLGCPLRSPYVAAKWAIVGLTKTWAIELGPFGVRVNALCPGSVEGPRIDHVIETDAKIRGLSPDRVRQAYLEQNSLGVFIRPENIAQTVWFLCSEAAQHISGQAIPIDGHTETLTS